MTDDKALSEEQEEEKLQMELDFMTNGKKHDSFGFRPEDFDQSKLPVPLFTGLVVMGFSIYTIVYFLWVGLNGFPEDDTFPRPF